MDRARAALNPCTSYASIEPNLEIGAPRGCKSRVRSCGWQLPWRQARHRDACGRAERFPVFSCEVSDARKKMYYTPKLFATSRWLGVGPRRQQIKSGMSKSHFPNYCIATIRNTASDRSEIRSDLARA